MLKGLKVFYGAELALGKPWFTMEKKVLSLENHLFNLAHNIATLAKVDFYNRWHMMTTHLHHVGAMLNPYLSDDLIIHEDVAGKSKFLNTMRKLTTCIDSQYDRVVVKFQVFEEHRGAFANMHLAIETNILPYNYSDLVGKKWHILGTLAKAYIGPSLFLFVV